MKKNLTYLESVHRDGKIWGIVICLLIFAFPIAVSIVYGAVPEWGALAKAMFATVPMYWAVGIVEIFTYVPMLGAGGTYLSVLDAVKQSLGIDQRASRGVNYYNAFFAFFDCLSIDNVISLIRQRTMQ